MLLVAEPIGRARPALLERRAHRLLERVIALALQLGIGSGERGICPVKLAELGLERGELGGEVLAQLRAVLGVRVAVLPRLVAFALEIKLRLRLGGDAACSAPSRRSAASRRERSATSSASSSLTLCCTQAGNSLASTSRASLRHAACAKSPVQCARFAACWL
jgi:hypothetical protein